MSFAGFWFGVTLINTFFLFRAFIENIVLNKRLEGVTENLVEKSKELMKIRSLLDNKIDSLVEELEELKNP